MLQCPRTAWSNDAALPSRLEMQWRTLLERRSVSG